MRNDWKVIEVVVRREHIRRGQVNHPWLHPIALAAVNSRLPGVFFHRGKLAVDDGITKFFVTVMPEIEAWVRAGGPIAREWRFPVALPPALILS